MCRAAQTAGAGQGLSLGKRGLSHDLYLQGWLPEYVTCAPTQCPDLRISRSVAECSGNSYAALNKVSLHFHFVPGPADSVPEATFNKKS